MLQYSNSVLSKNVIIPFKITIIPKRIVAHIYKILGYERNGRIMNKKFKISIVSYKGREFK